VAWRDEDTIVPECAAGLIQLRRTAGGLASAASPQLRDGPVDERTIAHLADVLRISRAAIVDAQWADNGPGWVAVLLGSAAEVLALRPGFIDLDLGVVGPYPPCGPAAFEVRAFFPVNGATVEDPVTGSLNASLAAWLLRTGRASAPYVASQGTVLGRAGRAYVSQDPDGTIWVGRGTLTCVRGEVEI
jgi:predicted PhzF superfamily epimerase YddE/YHI9